MATSEILVTAFSGLRCKTRKAKTPSVEELERDLLKNPDGTSTSPKVTKFTRKALSPTVKEWERDLLEKLNVAIPPRKVTESKFYDARLLFEPGEVILQESGKIRGTEMTLTQFDPNFLFDDVICCHPLCNLINPKAAKSGKRDLFLCPSHQQELRKSLSEVLAKNNIQCSSFTSAATQEPNQFAGYTLLISLLDVAWWYKARTLKQEAILNVRNFLIITNTLLNPDVSNLAFLPYVVEILREYLKSDCDVFVHVLREIVDIILSAFGVAFSWVSLALQAPESKIGAATLGIIGGVVGLVVFEPWVAIAMAAAGTYYGGLGGNGIAGMSNGKEKSTPKGALYSAQGFEDGRLTLSVNRQNGKNG